MSNKLYTFEQWNENPCELEVGARLDQELAEYFFDSSMYLVNYHGRKSISIDEWPIAFQHPEPCSHVYVSRQLIDGEVLYSTYAKIHGTWYYMGLCFEGEMIDRSDLDE